MSVEPLFPHQLEGAEFFLQRPRGLLADDCGLGKTRTAIELCDRLDLNRILVVCPSTIKSIWANEITKFSNRHEFIVVDGPPNVRKTQLSTKVRFTIISYDLARRHEMDLSHTWDMVILDEAHRVKNYRRTKSSSKQGKVLKHVSTAAKRLLLMTGTPITNEPVDLWALLNLLFPKRFPSFWGFVQQFCVVTSNGFGLEIGSLLEDRTENLRQLLADFTLKRTKIDVFPTMPRKTIQPLYVDLSDDDRAAYLQMSRDFYVDIGDESIPAPTILARMTRLRQLAISPQIIPEINPYQAPVLTGAKADLVMELLESVGDQKVVVFSQFLKAIVMLKSRIDAGTDFNTVTFTGLDDEASREYAREEFKNNPKCKVLLATTGAGAEGQTFTAASVAILLDEAWDPKTNNQAMDRLDRIGQTRPVTVYILRARGTIDEEIAEALGLKEGQIESVTGEELVRLIRAKLRPSTRITLRRELKRH